MTISIETVKAQFNGNASATEFSFTFPALNRAHVKAIKTSAAGVDTALALDTDYSVSLATGGGTAHYPLTGSPLAAGEKLTLYRQTPAVQETDLDSQGTVYLPVIEATLDRATMVQQEQAEALARAPKLPITAGTGGGTINVGDMRQSDYDGNGDGIVNAAAALADGTNTVTAAQAAAAVAQAAAAAPASHSHAISSVAGLQTALDAKAAASHTHTAGDTTSGEFAAARLPAMVGDSGSGGTKGAVPAPASGDATAGKYLKADGTWAVPPGGEGGGVSDHGALTGLADDDHTQYLDTTRGDARYYTESEMDTALGGKADASHTHAASAITSGEFAAARLPAMVGATSGAAGTKGAAPAPAAGDQEKYLRADGTWDVPSAGSVADGAITLPKLATACKRMVVRYDFPGKPFANAAAGNDLFELVSNEEFWRLPAATITAVRYRVRVADTGGSQAQLRFMAGAAYVHAASTLATSEVANTGLSVAVAENDQLKVYVSATGTNKNTTDLTVWVELGVTG